METTHRRGTPSRRRSRIGWSVTTAVALGTVSAAAAAAFATGTVGAASGKQVTVSVETVSKVGKVLVANGKPLYVLSPSGSSCATSCHAIWPALTLPIGVNSAVAGKGVQHANLGTTSGPNGLRQVTYMGQPVFGFAGDNQRGKVKGNLTDQWGKWTAVVVAKAAGSGSSGSSSNSGGTNAGSGGVSF